MTDNTTDDRAGSLHWWSDPNFAAAQILAEAGETAGAVVQAAPNPHPAAQGELNGLIRALCLVVDPILYDGSRYGLLRGSSVWRALWDRVTGIVNLSPGVREPAMVELYAAWPETRRGLIADRERANRNEIAAHVARRSGR